MKDLEAVKVEVKSLSPREKLTLLEALEIVLREETGIEVVHSDVAIEFYGDIADKYGLYAEYDEEVECEDCGYCNAKCICTNDARTILSA